MFDEERLDPHGVAVIYKTTQPGACSQAITITFGVRGRVPALLMLIKQSSSLFVGKFQTSGISSLTYVKLINRDVLVVLY